MSRLFKKDLKNIYKKIENTHCRVRVLYKNL